MIAVISVVIAVCVTAAVAFVLWRSRQSQVPLVREPRRAQELESHVGDLLTGPTHRYGVLFTSYEVWKTDQETRLELKTAPTWRKLNTFARSLVVRYLWRALERIAGGAVVVVDTPAMRWNAEVDTQFEDNGLDWLTVPNPWGYGPQFIKE